MLIAQGSQGSEGSQVFQGSYVDHGPVRAPRDGMGAWRFQDLVAWQLAWKLQQEIFAFTAMSPTSRDVKYCNQIRDSSRSTCRNTAEGFGRFYPREFIRFLR